MANEEKILSEIEAVIVQLLNEMQHGEHTPTELKDLAHTIQMLLSVGR